ncbi:MAG: hypothetical protein ACHQ49_14460 [Elusimicrobiota bacterium]
MSADDALGRLRHDVNGTCANLKSAAALLKGEASADELELLRLMTQQARSMADSIAAYEARRGGERPK